MEDSKFKTLTIDFCEVDDRNMLFDKICELRCLNIEETRKKMSVKGNVPYGKIIELCNNQGCDMKLLVAVEVKPAVGAVVSKNPSAIKETPVDSAPVKQDGPEEDDLF
jgi:hypothetical protein